MSKLWNLDVNEARDIDNKVRWVTSPVEQRLPPLILFAYFSHASDVPKTWHPPLGRWRPALYPALRHILLTGNKVPPIPFDTTYTSLQHEPDVNVSTPLNMLARWRSEKEFRACLWLHQIRLWRDGTLTKFSMSGAYDVGWTPPPVNSPSHRPSFPSLQGEYTPGVGMVRPSIVSPRFEPWGAYIKIEVGFRIDEFWPKYGSYFLFRRGVPFMRMVLELEVRSGGNHKVAFNGSYIPTQVYQAGSEVTIYDMIDDIGGYQVVKRTLGVGYEQPAPERSTPVVKYIP